MSMQDKAEIVEIMNLYGVALDAHRWDLFDLVFTDDVVAEFGPAGAAWRGLAEFETIVRGVFHQTLDSHQHTMMGQVVKVEGDKANAFSYGNWLLVRHAAEGGPTWQGTGWYDDALVRTDAGWRIGHRVCRLMSWTGKPGDTPNRWSDPQPRHAPQRPPHGERRRPDRFPQRVPKGTLTFVDCVADVESGAAAGFGHAIPCKVARRADVAAVGVDSADDCAGTRIARLSARSHRGPVSGAPATVWIGGRALISQAFCACSPAHRRTD